MAPVKQMLREVLESEAKRLHDQVIEQRNPLSRDDVATLKALVEIQALLESEPDPEDPALTAATPEELAQAAGLIP